jgi:Xaa-Pro aminopeptidase
MRARRDRVRERLAEAGAQGFLVTALPNIRYLSGFTGSAAILLLGADPPDLFITDGRYRTQVGEELDPELDVVITRDRARTAVLAAARDRGIARLAFERAHLSVAEWEAWREADGPELVGAGEWVETLRARKSPAEIELIARAAAIADGAFEAILEEVRPGVEERALALALDRLLVEAGAERPAFETIVAYGERSALPHARPTRRTLARGELVLFDFGAVVDGYHSDVSRTVACGDVGAELTAVYVLVAAAQRAALEGMRAGLTGSEADALARGVIQAADHGDRFDHSLGHGLGLEVHERPRLSRTSDELLEPTMVVTVEPGVYIPGTGGVRIEDDVVLHADGVRVLTAAPKDTLITL